MDELYKPAIETSDGIQGNLHAIGGWWRKFPGSADRAPATSCDHSRRTIADGALVGTTRGRLAKFTLHGQMSTLTESIARDTRAHVAAGRPRWFADALWATAAPPTSSGLRHIPTEDRHTAFVHGVFERRIADRLPKMPLNHSRRVPGSRKNRSCAGTDQASRLDPLEEFRKLPRAGVPRGGARS